MKEMKAKIIEAAKKKGMNETELLAKVDITRQGFNDMFKNRSIKLKTLEDISRVLELPLSYFLEGNESFLANEPRQPFAVYEDLIRSKDEIISMLKEELSQYKNLKNA